MRITWNEYLKLNKFLSDDEFSLLTLLMIHPELTLQKLAEWCKGMKKKYSCKEDYSIEGVRKKIISLMYKIEKLRGYKGNFEDFLTETKGYNTFKKELEDEMVNRYCQYFFELGNNTEAIWCTLQEYGYNMSYKAFDGLLRKKIGEKYISEMNRIRNGNKKKTITERASL